MLETDFSMSNLLINVQNLFLIKGKLGHKEYKTHLFDLLTNMIRDYDAMKIYWLPFVNIQLKMSDLIN